MPSVTQGTPAYAALFAKRNPNAVLLGSAIATPITPALVGANGQPLVMATATPAPAVTPITTVQAKPARTVTTAPAVKGTYQLPLPPNAVINPMPVVGQPTSYITPGATHCTVVQLCNVAQAYVASRGYACNASGGTTGTKPPLHPMYQLYVNGNRHYVQVGAIARLIATITGK
jgi:hypothetical protein